MKVNTLQPPTAYKYVPAPTASKGAFSSATSNKLLLGNMFVPNFSIPVLEADLNTWNESARQLQAAGFDMDLPYNGDPKLITDPVLPPNPTEPEE